MCLHIWLVLHTCCGDAGQTGKFNMLFRILLEVPMLTFTLFEFFDKLTINYCTYL